MFIFFPVTLVIIGWKTTQWYSFFFPCDCELESSCCKSNPPELTRILSKSNPIHFSSSTSRDMKESWKKVGWIIKIRARVSAILLQYYYNGRNPYVKLWWLSSSRLFQTYKPLMISFSRHYLCQYLLLTKGMHGLNPDVFFKNYQTHQ